MSLASVLPFSSRQDWLEQRRTGIGASEIAAVMGLSPWKTKLDVYRDKTGEAPEREPSEAMKIGLALEPSIAWLYTDRTGREIRNAQVLMRSADHPFLLATLDGVCVDGRIVEFKTASGFDASDWTDAPDGIPTHYLIQVHQQMLVAGKEECDVAALIGGSKFRVYTIQRDEPLTDLIISCGAEFWDRVQARQAPDPEFRDLEALAKIAPHIADVIDLTDSVRASELVEVYLDARRQIGTFENWRDQARAKLVALMEGHARALLPGGYEVSRKEVSRKEYTCAASSYVDFRVKSPKTELAPK